MLDNAVAGLASVPVAPAQGRCRETDAKEVRACCHVSTIKTPEIPLRRLHGAVQVSVACLLDINMSITVLVYLH